LAYVLGRGFTATFRPNELTVSKYDEDKAKRSLNKLEGTRLATVDESLGSNLNLPILKLMSGGDTLSASRMRQDDRQLKPTHKLILPTICRTRHSEGVSISYRFLRTTATVRNRTQSWNPRLRRRHPVGKTYLAKVIAWRACQANQRALFTTAMDMLNHLLAPQVDHSLIRKRSIPNPLFCWSTSYAIFRSINGLPTSSIRSSPPAIAMSAARSLRPTQPFPTGATSSTTPPSPLPSPIAWWKTPRSSFWEAKASQR